MSGIRKVFKFAGTDQRLGIAFAYGMVSKENGEEYFDAHGHNISDDEILQAAAELAQKGVVQANVMHKGEANAGTFPFMFPLTEEIADRMGIVAERYGLLIGFKASPETLAKIDSGELNAFSIEGRAREQDA